jgi:hypothetical protein
VIGTENEHDEGLTDSQSVDEGTWSHWMKDRAKSKRRLDLPELTINNRRTKHHEDLSIWTVCELSERYIDAAVLGRDGNRGVDVYWDDEETDFTQFAIH